MTLLLLLVVMPLTLLLLILLHLLQKFLLLLLQIAGQTHLSPPARRCNSSLRRTGTNCNHHTSWNRHTSSPSSHKRIASPATKLPKSPSSSSSDSAATAPLTSATICLKKVVSSDLPAEKKEIL
jgi:hypothetical protein